MKKKLPATTREYLDDVKSRHTGTHSPEQEELFKQVGRLVVGLSEVEHYLAIAYLSLNFDSDLDNAAKRYFSLRFDERLAAIGELLEADPSWEIDIDVWREFKGF